MSRPINLDTSDWGRFDPSSPTDAVCERERLAFTEYTLKRLRKIPRTGSTQEAIYIGGLMAMIQMTFAIHQGSPPDSVRDGLHDLLDFAWLQCASITADKEGLN